MKHSKKYTYIKKKGMGEFEVEIKLSSDFKLFFTSDQIPEELLKSYSGHIPKRVYGDWFQDLNKKILDIITEYEATFVEEAKSKVILYGVKYNDNIGHKIYFNYIVAQRLDITSSKKKETKYFEERSPIGNGSFRQKVLDEISPGREFDDIDYAEMPWTAEREAWFEAMATKIRDLAHQLEEGFGESSEVLAKKIDHGGSQFLLGYKEEHD